MERRVFDRNLIETYKDFKLEPQYQTPHSPLLKKNQPKNVETTNKKNMVECLCDMCTNVEINQDLIATSRTFQMCMWDQSPEQV